MDIAIVYYSYSGNTHRAAKVVEEVLKSQNNAVRRLRIEAPSESNNFFVQALRGLAKKKTEINPIETDLSGYDLIIFATPVWAGKMVPAMRKFLEKAGALGGKKAIVFVTYGSGFGKEHCLRSLEAAIEKKGANCLGRFSLSQHKVNDRALIEDLLKKNMCL
ncbi:MAG: NAD(P)H-dependent oxidoreductase [Candidatus Omnitrophica bacterium]|nr:NAD(P)H-dependent oxidoreductase [Candidatus Omnitrophota bacterium]